MRHAKLHTTLIAAALGLAAALVPADALTLKQTVTVGADVVRVGDFFTDAERHAETALFRAPMAGESGTVSASRLREAVYRLGMSWLPPADVSKITVTRVAEDTGRQLPLSEAETAISAALGERIGGFSAMPGEVIAKVGPGSPTMVLIGSHEHHIAVVGLNVDEEREEFDATIEVSQGERSRTYDLTGDFERFYEVPMLTGPVARGEILTPEQVATTRLRDPGAGVIVDAGSVIGMAARRNLRAGSAIRAGDLEKPKLVNRNELVTVVYSMPGMVLTTMGRALGDGARGETVPVLNVRSNRIIQTTVEASGRVSVGEPATRVAMQ